MIIKLTLFCSRYLASVLLPLSHYSFHLPPIHHNWSFLFTLCYQYGDNEIKAHLSVHLLHLYSSLSHTFSLFLFRLCTILNYLKPFCSTHAMTILPCASSHIHTHYLYTTTFISHPFSFPCMYTYTSEKKTVLNTERPWCKSYLSITTDLNLLMVIPRVYQMMSLLEGDTCSKDQGKRNDLLFAFLIIATLAVLGRTCRFLVHPFRGSSVHSNGNVRGWYLKFYRHGISYLTDWAVEIENM